MRDGCPPVEAGCDEVAVFRRDGPVLERVLVVLVALGRAADVLLPRAAVFPPARAFAFEDPATP
jgi:hypothetical protein